jgi:IS30 family transposase
MGYRQLSEQERYVIVRLHRQRRSMRFIASVLDRAPSTVSRELRRNATRYDGAYRPEKAHQYAVAKRRRSRRNLHYGPADFAPVVQALKRRWSPAQIAGRQRLANQRTMSKETIYRFIRRERRAGGQLWMNLRILSKFGRKRRGSPATRGRLAGKRHVSERPPEVEQRLQQGHWEGDTVMGADQRHCILTLVERVTGYLVIKKLKARSMAEATRAMTQAIGQLEARFDTITLDNGTEFHGYQTVEDRTGVEFYFATPYHSWERGTNENTNGLVRQYLPKGMCLKSLTQAKCDQIAKELNDRPRQRLGFRTPSEVFFARSVGCCS